MSKKPKLESTEQQSSREAVIAKYREFEEQAIKPVLMWLELRLQDMEGDDAFSLEERRLFALAISMLRDAPEHRERLRILGLF